MTNQQYRVIADRDKGDDPKWPDIEPGDRYVAIARDLETRSDDDQVVRIERPVPTIDEPSESLFGNIRVVTGQNLSVPAGATEGAIAVFSNPGILEDLPIGTVFVELISGRHVGGLMSVHPSRPYPHAPTREQIEEVLTSWFPEYEGVGSVINDAAAEIARVQR